MVEGWQNMSVVNYLLASVLGALLALPLYAAKVDMSGAAAADRFFVIFCDQRGRMARGMRTIVFSSVQSFRIGVQ
jgi:hypothetical protein